MHGYIGSDEPAEFDRSALQGMRASDPRPRPTPLNVYSDNNDRLAQIVEELNLRLDPILAPHGPEKAGRDDSPEAYNRLTNLNDTYTHLLDRLGNVLARIDL